MTDEELSELAEALQDACDNDARVAAGDCCPMGALFPELGPKPQATCLLLPLTIASGFTRGFDGLPAHYGWQDAYYPSNERAHALGQQFRAQYRSKS